MGALAASAVTVYKAWTEAGTNGRLLSARVLTIVLSSQGGATNTVGAAALGFSYIVSSSVAQKSDDSVVYLTSPSYDGTKLFVYDMNVTTDADRSKPVDISATVRVLVKGYAA
jgi:hypothetical protein